MDDKMRNDLNNLLDHLDESEGKHFDNYYDETKPDSKDFNGGCFLGTRVARLALIKLMIDWGIKVSKTNAEDAEKMAEATVLRRLIETMPGR